jgi:exonuclease VII small subunit
MAKWSGVYLEDCHKLLKKIEKKLEKVVDEESNHQWISVGMETEIENGRYKLAKELQDKIKKWRKEMYNE